MFVRQIPMTVGKLKLFNKILLKEDFPISLDRSSRPEVFYKKAVLKAFLKFTWQNLQWSSVLSKFADLG